MPRPAKRDRNTQAPSIIQSASGDPALGPQLRDDGPVLRLGAPSLERPLEFPASQWRRLGIIVAVAAALCVALIVAYNVKVFADVQQMQAAVGQAIDRDVSLDLPQLESYAGKTNKAMFQQFEEDGYTIYDNSNDEDESVNGFDAFKLAPDVDPDEAAAAYSQGIENLDDVDAARYLAGSWRFLVSRSDGAEIRLRYADFDAQDAQEAIQDAAAGVGFDAAGLGGMAQDDQGNTNASGTFEKAGTTYEYTISACDLQLVYDIDGAPAGSQFVGIRVVEAAG